MDGFTTRSPVCMSLVNDSIFFFKSSKNGGENVRIACRSVDCFVSICVSHTISFACLRGICFLPVAFVHLENFVLKVSE